MTNLSYIESNRKGFTLIEIMVVLTIMVLSLSIAVPAIWKSLGKTKVKTYVREAAATFRFARSRAIATKKTVRVIVDIDRDSIEVKEISSKGKQKNDDDFRDEKEDDANLYEEPDREKSPTNIIGFRTDTDEKMQEEGKVTVHFYPLGNSDGGEFVIAGTRRNLNYIIRIENISGRIHIDETHNTF